MADFTFNDFYVNCICGDEILRVSKDEDGDVFVSLYHSEFYSRQGRFWETVWDRIRHAFFVLTGRDYLLFDLVVGSERWDELKDFVNSK